MCMGQGSRENDRADTYKHQREDLMEFCKFRVWIVAYLLE